MPYKNKEIQKEFQKQHYKNNKNKYRESTKNRRTRNKKFVYSMKTFCAHCGMKDKLCLDFHHLNDKFKNVSQLIRNATSIDKLRLEIEKCEVVCGNCHNKIHLPIDLKDGSEWVNFEKFRIEKRKWYIEYIKNCFCFDCGENDRRCLNFHHLQNKLFKISTLLTSGHSLNFLKKEISKCIVVCVNCHRKRHGVCDVMVA